MRHSKTQAADSLQTQRMLSLIKCDQNLTDRHQDSQIARFYANRCIFVTGASGFVGKVLLEKLLRSCPDIKRVFILMRPKRGKLPLERVKDLTESEIFSRLKSMPAGEEQLLKISAVAGDITQPLFGLSLQDIQLLRDNVSLAVHSAATVKFHEPLRVAIQNNLVSVRNLLDLAGQLTRLEALVHVSTAYSNCDRELVDEVLYKPPIEPEKLMELSEWMNDALLNSITPQLLGKRPNTYTYTKACAESLLCEIARVKLPNLPVAVIRPSIVTGSWREPLRGWVDNLNGPTGVVLAMMSGAMQAMRIKPSCQGDLIPVDIVANLILCAAWEAVEMRRGKQLPTIKETDDDSNEGSNDHSKLATTNTATTTTTITTTTATTTTAAASIESYPRNRTAVGARQQVRFYNCVSGAFNPIKWGDFAKFVWVAGLTYPCENILRPPFKMLIANEYLYKSVDLLNHKLVAYVCDSIFALLGRKRRLVSLYSKLDKMVYTLKPFVLNQWQFDCSNVVSLRSELSPVDRNMFNFDISNLNWFDYIQSYYVGCKLFVLKDDPKKVGLAQRRLKSKQTANWLAALVLVLIAYYTLIAGTRLEAVASSALSSVVASVVGFEQTPASSVGVDASLATQLSSDTRFECGALGERGVR